MRLRILLDVKELHSKSSCRKLVELTEEELVRGWLKEIWAKVMRSSQNQLKQWRCDSKELKDKNFFHFSRAVQISKSMRDARLESTTTKQDLFVLGQISTLSSSHTILPDTTMEGSGYPGVVFSLKDLLFFNKPKFLFLMETLVHLEKMEELRVTLQFDNCFYVDRVGYSRGLAFLLNSSNNACVVGYSNNYVGVLIEEPDHPKWWLTRFYNFPK
ncbi:hypothetical protein Gotri_004244 [Gossypium trilobum]|uniref:Uncharacterized protein n=1 Tax=Gossypium trilobum TaxID=34281 RepID=A0A7J9F596_9ROSI|nr:hypothetical protein [Gossypium trilobum]